MTHLELLDLIDELRREWGHRPEIDDALDELRNAVAMDMTAPIRRWRPPTEREMRRLEAL